MKVCFETFGCRLSRAEALDEEAKYLANGWETTSSHADANLIIVRGCSVTRRAQRDCEKLIEHIRAKYPFKRVMVTGCLESKSASFFLADPAIKVRGKSAAPKGPAVPTRTARAYLKVQDGCNSGCTFCIVPRFRGKSVSVPFEDCLAKARLFVEAGYREIVVTGCNLVQYLSDGKRLPDLVAALAAVSPACRVRLGSVEPGAVAMETVGAMAENANVCRFLHVPIQSASPRILTAMRRPYTVKDVDALITEAAKRMPRLGLGCDIITGFPDETDIDFMTTTNLLKRLPINKVHVFPYSERPGTPAATMPFPVMKEVRHARAHEVAQISDASRSAFAKRFIGRDVEVLIEDKEKMVGWTGEYLWCEVDTVKKFERKEIVRVRVRESKEHILKGVPVNGG